MEHKIGTMPHGRIVLVEVTFDGTRVSMSGTIGHHASIRAGNFDSGGQNQDTIREALDSGELRPVSPWTHDSIRRLLDTWDRWHLNGMRPGCAHQMAAGWGERPIDPSKPLNAYGKHFPGQRQDSWNMLAWVRPDEYPDGLLTVACEVCGHRYGTTWETERLPNDVREYVLGLV